MSMLTNENYEIAFDILRENELKEAFTILKEKIEKKELPKELYILPRDDYYDDDGKYLGFTLLSMHSDYENEDSLAIVKFFLELTDNFEQEFIDQAFHVACVHGCKKIARMLRAKGAISNKNILLALMEHGDELLLRELLKEYEITNQFKKAFIAECERHEMWIDDENIDHFRALKEMIRNLDQKVSWATLLSDEKIDDFVSDFEKTFFKNDKEFMKEKLILLENAALQDPETFTMNLNKTWGVDRGEINYVLFACMMTNSILNVFFTENALSEKTDELINRYATKELNKKIQKITKTNR